MKKFCKKLGEIFKAIFDGLYKIIEFIAILIYNIIKKTLIFLWETLKFIYNITVVPYFALFKCLLLAFRSLGIIGELIFIFIGLVYLLWPIPVAYFYLNKAYYIPAAILAIFLVIKGRMVIV